MAIVGIIYYLLFIKNYRMSSSSSHISVFIPRVGFTTSENNIKDIFRVYNVGSVNYVDFIVKKDKKGRQYLAAYVHFKYLYDRENAYQFISCIKNKKSQVRIYYNPKNFWVVQENKYVGRKNSLIK